MILASTGPQRRFGQRPQCGPCHARRVCSATERNGPSARGVGRNPRLRRVTPERPGRPARRAGRRDWCTSATGCVGHARGVDPSFFGVAGTSRSPRGHRPRTHARFFQSYYTPAAIRGGAPVPNARGARLCPVPPCGGRRSRTPDARRSFSVVVLWLRSVRPTEQRGVWRGCASGPGRAMNSAPFIARDQGSRAVAAKPSIRRAFVTAWW